MKANLPESWLNLLEGEFDKPYMQALKAFLLEEQANGYSIFPKGNEIFSALNHTPFNQVKVVILGQDPYHNIGQANGLSFSVKKGVTVPPSLKNIYKELASEFADFKTPNHGDLTQWTKQGVLLLNATLTVRAHTPGSHQKKGWEQFTDKIISTISVNAKGIVFILWGNYAKQKEALIDTDKHFVIKSAHPSPFSAYNGFFGSKPFSAANLHLENQKLTPINWQID